jgi:hypothetical protein
MRPEWFPAGGSGSAPASTTPTLISTTSGIASGTTLSLPNPTGLKTGDLLLTALISGSISAGFPTGFTFLWGVGTFTGGDVYLFTRIVQTGDPANTSYTGIQTGALVVQAGFRGMNGNFDVYNNPPYASGNSTAPANGGFTTTLNSDLLIQVCGFGGSTTFTPASGWTTAKKVDSVSGTNYGGAIAYLVQTSAGATGTITAGLGGSAVWGSGLFSFAA